MTTTAPIPPITGSATVGVPLEQAFRVFTGSFGTWWPREFHIGQAEMAEAILEPREGGRWYERGVDGSECDWGRVLEWEPPARVLLAWHLDADWKYDPDPAKSTALEVQFISEGPAATRVELVHRGFEVHGERSQEVHGGIDSPEGWSGLLKLFRPRTFMPAAR